MGPLVPWIDQETAPIAVGMFDRASVAAHVAPDPFRLRSLKPAAIDNAWHKARRAADAAGDELFDGPLLRLQSAFAAPNALELRLQPTSFRYFVGTNLDDPGLPPADRADPLGISAIIITADAQILLGRRSHRVHRHKGRLHCIGGHLEPPRDLGGERTTVDTFAAITTELVEELNVDAEDLLDLTCLGVVRERASAQPEQLFVVKVGRSATAIAPRGSEHEDLVAIDADPTSIGRFLTTRADETVPVARAALHLYRGLVA